MVQRSLTRERRYSSKEGKRLGSPDYSTSSVRVDTCVGEHQSSPIRTQNLKDELIGSIRCLDNRKGMEELPKQDY